VIGLPDNATTTEDETDASHAPRLTARPKDGHLPWWSRPWMGATVAWQLGATAVDIHDESNDRWYAAPDGNNQRFVRDGHLTCISSATARAQTRCCGSARTALACSSVRPTVACCPPPCSSPTCVGPHLRGRLPRRGLSPGATLGLGTRAPTSMRPRVVPPGIDAWVVTSAIQHRPCLDVDTSPLFADLCSFPRAALLRGHRCAGGRPRHPMCLERRGLTVTTSREAEAAAGGGDRGVPDRKGQR